ncbi:hypothetical protein N7462_008285 [Penicillium macrosclerotiorum]|uniref:uncharacterized protein n=1 Tax=Penicillium macrosclerotiorum TaxID=303699 RepID=UPI0025480599|nr:uncharacterized protein N7462_008285 [Penicillium macrosclerotiorum]KAJ5675388.1 hypothetical protein N7462_008285 [Penicillium macrosclerotiorum]
MPSSTRPLSPEFQSPVSKKRRVSWEDDSIFAYPILPDDCVNKEHGAVQPVGSVEELRHMHLVRTTDSVEWGDASVAAKRALIEPKVTSSNKELLRTYHPSLSCLPTVYLAEESKDKWIWVISPDPDTAESISTHAGDLEIHLAPGGLIEQTTTKWPKLQPDPIIGTLTPRKFFSRGHLQRLREMFPTSIGARVFISGYIVILFKSRTDVEESWLHDGLADTFGALRLRYDILEDSPTQKAIARGAAIAAKPDCVEAYTALGLKLRFPEGQEAITVPTHAFVGLRGIRTSALRRIADLYYLFKQKLARYSPIQRGLSLPAIGSAWRQPIGNSPLGKQVFLAGGSEEARTNDKCAPPPPVDRSMIAAPPAQIDEMITATAVAITVKSTVPAEVTGSIAFIGTPPDRPIKSSAKEGTTISVNTQSNTATTNQRYPQVARTRTSPNPPTLRRQWVGGSTFTQ